MGLELPAQARLLRPYRHLLIPLPTLLRGGVTEKLLPDLGTCLVLGQEEIWEESDRVHGHPLAATGLLLTGPSVLVLWFSLKRLLALFPICPKSERLLSSEGECPPFLGLHSLWA